MSVDLVPGDAVSASFTSLSMLTLFLPALLLISPIKSAFTHPCSSSTGKGMERVRVCSWAAIGQAGQVNRKRVERGGLRRTREQEERQIGLPADTGKEMTMVSSEKLPSVAAQDIGQC